MKSHKYWSIGALITMLGTFYAGYKGSKEGHKYFAASSLLDVYKRQFSICLLSLGERRIALSRLQISFPKDRTPKA